MDTNVCSRPICSTKSLETWALQGSASSCAPALLWIFLLRFSPRILRLNRAPAGVSPTALALVSSCELPCEHRKGLALSACWDRTKHEVCPVPSLGIIMGWWGDVAPPSLQGKKKKYSSFGSKDPDGVCISPFTVATNIMRQTGQIMKK